MSRDDSNLNYRRDQKIRNLARQGGSFYDNAAAYSGGRKPAAPDYPGRVFQVLRNEDRLVSFLNQETGTEASIWSVLSWLQPGSNAGWIHCLSDDMPNPSNFRCYVCADLTQTHTLLGLLLAGYGNRPLYFKVPDHDEGRGRNDTIVSWHETLDDARAWCDIARNNPGMLLGEAPPGSFGGAGVLGGGDRYRNRRLHIDHADRRTSTAQGHHEQSVHLTVRKGQKRVRKGVRNRLKRMGLGDRFLTPFLTLF